MKRINYSHYKVPVRCGVHVFASDTNLCFIHVHDIVSVGFSEDPSSLNVTAGNRVQFHCVHPSSIAVTWIINGTMLSPSNFPPGVSVSATFLNSNGFRHTLTIYAIYQDDNTALTCALTTDESVHSEPAVLRVQG